LISDNYFCRSWCARRQTGVERSRAGGALWGFNAALQSSGRGFGCSVEERTSTRAWARESETCRRLADETVAVIGRCHSGIEWPYDGDTTGACSGSVFTLMIFWSLLILGSPLSPAPRGQGHRGPFSTLSDQVRALPLHDWDGLVPSPFSHDRSLAKRASHVSRCQVAAARTPDPSPTFRRTAIGRGSNLGRVSLAGSAFGQAGRFSLRGDVVPRDAFLAGANVDPAAAVSSAKRPRDQRHVLRLSPPRACGMRNAP
jgi:hypothetical protein